MIVFSAGGTTAVPIEMAHGARRRGLPVIAVTSLEQSRAGGRALVRDAARSTTPTSCSTCARRPAMRSSRSTALETPVAPGSSLAAVALANEIKVRDRACCSPSAARCRRCWPAPAVVGAEESAALFDAAYAEHARRLARTLRQRPGLTEEHARNSVVPDVRNV